MNLDRVTLLNDLEAIAHAVPHLSSDEATEINAGRAVAHSPIAILVPALAPGTCLREAFLIWSGHLRVGRQPRVLPQLQDGAFMHAFSAKGRFARLLRAVPVHVITVNAALQGTASTDWSRQPAIASREPRPSARMSATSRLPFASPE